LTQVGKISAAELCRKHGVSDATFYKWRAKYGGMDVSDAKKLKALEDENAKLKRLLAESVMDNATLSEKAQTLSLMTFSLLALILAAVGIHGVLAYSVAQQRRDIGIRMALGASHRDVAWSILRQASLLALIGAVAGLLGSLAISPLIRGSLFGIGPQDPTVFVTSGLVLVVIAALAAWFPARRATLVNPVEALRAE